MLSIGEVLSNIIEADYVRKSSTQLETLKICNRGITHKKATICIVGAEKSGKSTIVNCLVGSDAFSKNSTTEPVSYNITFNQDDDNSSPANLSTDVNVEIIDTPCISKLIKDHGNTIRSCTVCIIVSDALYANTGPDRDVREYLNYIGYSNKIYNVINKWDIYTKVYRHPDKGSQRRCYIENLISTNKKEYDRVALEDIVVTTGDGGYYAMRLKDKLTSSMSTSYSDVDAYSYANIYLDYRESSGMTPEQQYGIYVEKGQILRCAANSFKSSGVESIRRKVVDYINNLQFELTKNVSRLLIELCNNSIIHQSKKAEECKELVKVDRSRLELWSRARLVHDMNKKSMLSYIEGDAGKALQNLKDDVLKHIEYGELSRRVLHTVKNNSSFDGTRNKRISEVYKDDIVLVKAYKGRFLTYVETSVKEALNMHEVPGARERHTVVVNKTIEHLYSIDVQMRNVLNLASCADCIRLNEINHDFGLFMSSKAAVKLVRRPFRLIDKESKNRITIQEDEFVRKVTEYTKSYLGHYFQCANSTIVSHIVSKIEEWSLNTMKYVECETDNANKRINIQNDNYSEFIAHSTQLKLWKEYVEKTQRKIKDEHVERRDVYNCSSTFEKTHVNCINETENTISGKRTENHDTGNCPSTPEKAYADCIRRTKNTEISGHKENCDADNFSDTSEEAYADRIGMAENTESNEHGEDSNVDNCTNAFGGAHADYRSDSSGYTVFCHSE